MTEQKDVQSGTPHVTNFNIAASQLKEPQDSGHKSDVPPAEESSTSWLEKHKDSFIQVKRSGALHRHRPNVQRPKARSVEEARQKQRRNTLDRLLNLDNGVVSPRAQDERDAPAQQGSDVLGPMSQWRNRVYRVRKRVGDFLGRAGAAVYPASGVERKQLDTFEAEMDQAEKPQQQQQQQQQVGEGEPVQYPNLGGELAKLGEATPANNQAQEHQEVNNNDNSNNTAHQIAESLLEELLGEQQARLLEERLRQLRGEDTEEVVPSNDDDAPAASTLPLPLPPLLPPLLPSKSPSPRPFHINHVAHLAPSYIAAQQSRQRADRRQTPPPPPPPPSSSSPLPQKSSRRGTGGYNTTATTTTTTTTTIATRSRNSSNTQVDTAQQRISAQPLWKGANRSREIWFGVGPGTGRDVGGRRGQGRRV